MLRQTSQMMSDGKKKTKILLLLSLSLDHNIKMMMISSARFNFQALFKNSNDGCKTFHLIIFYFSTYVVKFLFASSILFSRARRRAVFACLSPPQPSRFSLLFSLPHTSFYSGLKCGHKLGKGLSKSA